MNRCLLCTELTSEPSYCRKCKPKGASRGWRWSTVIVPAVLARDGHRCTQCGKPCPHPHHHDVDHVKAQAMGGTDDMSNLRTLCASTNRGGTRCA